MTHELLTLEEDDHEKCTTRDLRECIETLEGIIKTLLPSIPPTLTLSEEQTNDFLVSLSAGYQRRDEKGFEVINGDFVGVKLTIYRTNGGNSVLTTLA